MRHGIDTSIKKPDRAPGAEFELANQKGIVEALIFAAAKPLTISQIANASHFSKKTVEGVIVELNEEYAETGRSFRIEYVAGAYRMFTLPEYHAYINRANIREKSTRLTQAALETLSVVAYKQPVTRVEIERIRGVDCGGVLKNLMAKEFVAIDSRSPAPGNPILYKTTEFFLEFFGLPSLEHLPALSEIQEQQSSLPVLKIVRSGETSQTEQDDTNNEDANGETDRSGAEFVEVSLNTHTQT